MSSALRPGKKQGQKYMMKTVSQAAVNAEPARAFADIWRRPLAVCCVRKHKEEAVLRALFAQNERIPNGWGDARSSA
jgi:hypothetical protein